MNDYRGVLIGGKHTYSDFGLIMSAQNIGLPQPKTNLIDVLGRDGSIDLTESFGAVRYEDRECSWTFATDSAYRDRQDALRFLYNHLHGSYHEFILDSDPEYTYRGRFYCEPSFDKPSATEIKVRAVCNPYRIKTLVDKTVNAACGVEVVLNAGRRKVSPLFSCEREFSVACGGTTARLQSGTWRVRDLYISGVGNVVYLDSTVTGGDVSWLDLTNANITLWNQIQEQYWSGVIYTQETSSELKQDPSYNVRIQYSWEDL